MNILITCAGRRNYLVDYFKDAVHPVGGKVHVFNTDQDSAAYWSADVPVISPFATDPEYAAFVENYCISQSINAVLSCMDVDLHILSAVKEKFAALGIAVIIADPWVTETALEFTGVSHGDHRVFARSTRRFARSTRRYRTEITDN